MSGSQWVFSPKFPQEAIEQLLGLLGRSKIGRETQDIFVKLTEEARRERLRRLDAGLHTLDDIGWLSHLSLEFFFWGGDDSKEQIAVLLSLDQICWKEASHISSTVIMRYFIIFGGTYHDCHQCH